MRHDLDRRANEGGQKDKWDAARWGSHRALLQEPELVACELWRADMRDVLNLHAATHNKEHWLSQRGRNLLRSTREFNKQKDSPLLLVMLDG